MSYPRSSSRCREAIRNLRLVPHPEPMLSVSARRWPEGGRWVLNQNGMGFDLSRAYCLCCGGLRVGALRTVEILSDLGA